MLWCPSCQTEAAAGKRFCRTCGGALQEKLPATGSTGIACAKCPSCKSEIAAEAKFCRFCGASLKLAAEKESVPATQTAPTEAPLQQPHPLPGSIFSTSPSSSGIGTKLAVILIMIAVVGLAVFTNPSMEDYQVFIRQKLLEKARSEGDKTGEALVSLLGGIATNFIATQTVRNDYLLFSRYETRLGDERLVAVGVLKRFLVLQAPESILKPANSVSPSTSSVPEKRLKPTEASASPATGYIQSINATVASLLFFESGMDAPPKGQRQYATRFTRGATTRYINWELNLSYPQRDSPADFTVRHIWYRPDSSIERQDNFATYVRAGWASSNHNAAGWGSASGENWQLGTYRVDLYVDNIKIASGNFEIVDKPLVPLDMNAVPILPIDIPQDSFTGEKIHVVGNGVTEPIPIFQPNPPYTEEARNAGVAGFVKIQVVIRRDGTVDSFKVVKSLGYGLDESAINTIKTKWRFRPGMLNGSPVSVLANIDVTFRLYGSAPSPSSISMSSGEVATPSSITRTGEMYQAENAMLSGSAKISSEHRGFGGTGYVDGYGQNGVGATTMFSVSIQSPGEYLVTLRYANATLKEMTLSIYQDGVKVRRITLPSMNTWDDWSDASTILNFTTAGQHHVAYRYDPGDSGNVNLDLLRISSYPLKKF